MQTVHPGVEGQTFKPWNFQLFCDLLVIIQKIERKKKLNLFVKAARIESYLSTSHLCCQHTDLKLRLSETSAYPAYKAPAQAVVQLGELSTVWA